MAELPKIVEQRLAQQAAAGNAGHPDANLLAAFAEHALVERERAAVSAHLAQCADCRESLALAIASQPETELVAAHATKRDWFAEWRWVGAAAAACCVVGIVLQVQPPQAPVVRKIEQTVASPANTPPVREDRNAQPRVQIAGARRSKKVERIGLAEVVAPAPGMVAVQEHMAAVQEQPALKEKATLEVRPPETTSAEVTIRPNEPSVLPAPSTTLLPPASKAQAFRAETSEDAQTKKETQALQALRARAGAFAQGMITRAPVMPTRAKSALSNASVLWSINASPTAAGNPRGVVERSTDAGKTWEAVPLGDNVSFRAVASSGQNVWAGGTGGTLFHSSDAGAHWERITVADENGTLTGTIITIDAADPKLIKITTRSGERWTSPDGGRRWTQQ